MVVRKFLKALNDLNGYLARRKANPLVLDSATRFLDARYRRSGNQ